MRRSLRLVALGVLAVALISPACAQTTPGPPDWQDRGHSVYMPNVEKPHPVGEPAVSVPEITASTAMPSETVAQPAAKTSTDPTAIVASKTFDSKIVPSAHVESSLPEDSSARRLAPPSARESNGELTSHGGRNETGMRRLFDFGIPTQSIYMIVTALTIVIGTFLIFVWLLRRGTRGAAGRRGIVPAEAVSVLGRVPLTGRQIAELLRVGNKLVLVALTPGGAETLTEVTDPAEVDRLVGLCQQQDRRSATHAFEQVFQNFSREPTDNGFLGADSLPASISPVAAAYRSHRGGTARG
jgi:flagellar biogenesis protein FliO